MPKTFFVEGDGAPEMPEWQSPQRIDSIFSQTKTGDIVHIVPKGQKLAYYQENLGAGEIHGCVDETSTPEKVTVWSTFFIANPEAFRDDEPRSFSLGDVSLIERVPAEKYIERESKGRFKYGSEATVSVRGEKELVTIGSYFNEFVSGVNQDGKRISGGADFFKPYK